MPSKILLLSLVCCSTLEPLSGFVSPARSRHHCLSTSEQLASVANHAPISVAVNINSALFSSAFKESAKSGSADPTKGLHRDADVIFSIIDADGNGSISRKELSDHLSASGYTEQVIDKIFAKLDKNKDDSISEEEFRTGFAILPGLQSAPGLGNFNAQFVKEIHQDADQAFQSTDANGNGFIDEFELKSHLGRMFGKYSENAIQKIFRLLDANGDKKISREEFRDAFVQYSALRQAIGEGPNYK